MTGKEVSDDTDTWRAQTSRDRAESNAQVRELEVTIERLEKAVAANTTICADVQTKLDNVDKNTREIVEFFTAGKGAIKVLNAVGTIAKWVTGVSAAAVLLYMAMRGGK